MRIEDIEGRTVRELRGSSDAGLNRVAWDLLQTPTTQAQSAGEGTGRRGAAATTGQRGAGRRGAGAGVSPATSQATAPQTRREGEAPIEPQRTAAQERAEQPSEQQEEGERPATSQRGGRG